MVEPQKPGLGVAFSFPPHRRSHLKSATHRNLVRLIFPLLRRFSTCHCPSHYSSSTNTWPHLDMNGGNQKISNAFGFSSDKSLTVEVSNSKMKFNKKRWNWRSLLALMREYVLLVRWLKMESLKRVKFLVTFSLPMSQLLLPDNVVSEKKVEEKQISGGIFEGKHLHCIEESTAFDRTYEFTSSNRNVALIANKVTPGELEGSETDWMVNELGMMQRNEGGGKIQKQIGSKGQVSKSKTKKDVGLNNKKKQSLTPADKKEKKKKNKRKRRAEKNRQLGVKRLKLQTVLKPKPVSYCCHYLKGRCHEVPVTPWALSGIETKVSSWITVALELEEMKPKLPSSASSW